MNQWLLHVGMPKCASTTIQNICKNSPDIFYDSSARYSYNLLSHEPIAESFNSNPNDYYKSLALQSNGSSSSLLTTYSAEAFASNLPLNVVSSETFIGLCKQDIIALAKTFLDLNIKPSVLLVTRNIISYTFSSWKQSVRFGCTMPLHEYGKHKAPNFNKLIGKWNLAFEDVDVLQIHEESNFVSVFRDYILRKFNTQINANLCPEMQNISKFLGICYAEYIKMMASGDHVFSLSNINFLWPSSSPEMPSFDIKAHNERQIILQNIQTRLQKDFSIDELIAQDFMFKTESLSYLL